MLYCHDCAVAVYYVYTKYIRGPTETDFRSFSGITPVGTGIGSGAASAEEEGGFIQKMKNGERSVAIF